METHTLTNKKTWKRIKNYPDYFINQFGEVLSLRTSKEKILKNVENKNNAIGACVSKPQCTRYR